MIEPRREPRPKNGIRTEGFDQLFDKDFFAKASEGAAERIRFLPIKVSHDGQDYQFVLKATLDTRTKGVYVSIMPAEDAVRTTPALASLRFGRASLSGDTITAQLVTAVRQAVTDMEQAGYIPDPAVNNLLHAG